MIRIGVDVGGTNTDAVLMDLTGFRAGSKQLTTPDIISGVKMRFQKPLQTREKQFQTSMF